MANYDAWLTTKPDDDDRPSKSERDEAWYDQHGGIEREQNRRAEPEPEPEPDDEEEL